MLTLFLCDSCHFCALQELIDTEKEYVTDLATIVNGYMKIILEQGLPQDPGRERVIFGNILQIYEWHRE